MSVVQEILNRAMTLSEKERAEIAHKLLSSLEPEPEEDPAEVEQAWLEEIERRMDLVEKGEGQLVDAFEAIAKLRKELQEGI